MKTKLLMMVVVLALATCAVRAQDCVSNCVAVERFDEDFYVVARDAAGLITNLQLIGQGLPDDAVTDLNAKLAGTPYAEPVPLSEPDDKGGLRNVIQKSGGDTYTRVHVVQYETQTHWIVITITLIYDSATDELLAVDTQQISIKKPVAEITDRNGN